MRHPIRALGAAVLVVCTLVLGACAGLPVSGPVNAGGPIAQDDGEAPDFSYVPDGPAVDATPAQIVEGFLLAGSGSRDNWAIAKEFLAPEFQDVWTPEAGVTVYAPGGRGAARERSEGDEDEIVLTVRPEATVDATGVYSVETGQDVQLVFEVRQQADGQWRITRAPDGIVLDRNRFTSVFGSYALMYFDPGYEYLVPDVRWFPVTNSATSIASALVDGAPSALLQGAVRTAFTDATRLARQSVPETSGVAEVALQTSVAQLDQSVLDRMQTQLEASLATAGVSAVEMSVDGQVLEAQAVSTRSVRVDTRPLVLLDGAFGFLSGAEVEPLEALTASVGALAPTDIEVSASRQSAALRTSDGAVWRIAAGGLEWLLDDRDDLIAPTMDAGERIWSVPASDPSALVVYDPNGTPSLLEGAWTGATRITAMRISRDGTRVVAAVRDGAQPAVWVSSIQRDETGAPVGLGEHVTIATLASDASALSWLGAAAVVVVTADESGSVVREQPIGGPGSTVRAPADVRVAAGGNQSGTTRLLTGGAELLDQRGATWISVSPEVDALAVQRGVPQ